MPPHMGHTLYLVHICPGTLCVPMAGSNDSPLMGALTATHPCKHGVPQHTVARFPH